MPIVLIDGKSASTTLRPSDFVKQNAPGPYTSLVVLKNGAIPFWGLHLERLKQSLSARCDDLSAKRWNTTVWRLNKAKEGIDNLNLLRDVQDAASKIRESKGKRTDASIIICISEEQG